MAGVTVETRLSVNCLRHDLENFASCVFCGAMEGDGGQPHAL